MQPILQVLADGRDHSSVEIRDSVADHFRLSPEDRTQSAGNSTQDRFTNEHAFALVDLQRLKLIQKPNPREFIYQITDSGRAHLRNGLLPSQDSIFDAGGNGSASSSPKGPVDHVETNARSAINTRAQAPKREGTRQDDFSSSSSAAEARFSADAERTIAAAVVEQATAGASRVDRSTSLAPGDQQAFSGQRRVVVADKDSFEGYEYWRPEARVVAQQQEFELVARFRRFLTKAGHRHRQEQVRVGFGWIVYDLYDESRRILFEAKADASSREQVRMAIGQLFDYSYHGFETEHRRPHKALLLPAAPPDDLAELLAYLNIGLAYEENQGHFDEDYPWQ